MRINKTEEQFLFNQKVHNGLSAWEANFEIERDKEFIKYIKDYKKQAEHLLSQLNKAYIEIYKLRDINKALRKEKFVDKLKNYDTAEEKDRADTIILSRILTLLEEEKQIGLDDLAKTCCKFNHQVCRNAVGFLQKFNIIEIKQEGKIKFICLKKEVDNNGNGN